MHDTQVLQVLLRLGFHHCANIGNTVVLLSHAILNGLRCLDKCLVGWNDLPVVVTVLEEASFIRQDTRHNVHHDRSLVEKISRLKVTISVLSDKFYAKGDKRVSIHGWGEARRTPVNYHDSYHCSARFQDNAGISLLDQAKHPHETAQPCGRWLHVNLLASRRPCCS
jgi:hypothetical protein